MHTLTLTGRTTLLMKNVDGADPYNEDVKAIGRLNSLKGKITDEQDAERSYLKWLVSMYRTEDDGPILPAANVFRSIQQGASLTREGKDIERALVIHGLHAPLEYPGPRDLGGLWNGGKGAHVDRRMARVNRVPIPTFRPAFPVWSATFEFDLDENLMNLDAFAHVAEKAGRLIHIGDYRRFFGAYTVELR
jgi:hypothetical protein